MKIGVFTALFSDKSLEETLDIVQGLGLAAVELGVGAYPGAAHLQVEKFLGSQSDRKRLMKELERRNLEISALSCHGNPLHPLAEISNEHHKTFLDAVELAHLLGVQNVSGFSGCPGDKSRGKTPNWVTCAWPDEYRELLTWQWDRKVVPYWREQSKLLKSKGVRFCIEMHPGFVCYSNDTLLKLRERVGRLGDTIGANFDPSHLWWQGIDPLVAVRELAEQGALYHVHAKDLRIDPSNSARNGNLDAKSYSDVAGRSWVFRTVGYGHDVFWWRDFCSVLRTVGYDGVLSIEHEDALMSPIEGLTKAVSTLRDAIIREPAGPMFWAKE